MVMLSKVCSSNSIVSCLVILEHGWFCMCIWGPGLLCWCFSPAVKSVRHCHANPKSQWAEIQTGSNTYTCVLRCGHADPTPHRESQVAGTNLCHRHFITALVTMQHCHHLRLCAGNCGQQHSKACDLQSRLLAVWRQAGHHENTNHCGSSGSSFGGMRILEHRLLKSQPPKGKDLHSCLRSQLVQDTSPVGCRA